MILPGLKKKETLKDGKYVAHDLWARRTKLSLPLEAKTSAGQAQASYNLKLSKSTANYCAKQVKRNFFLARNWVRMRQ